MGGIGCIRMHSRMNVPLIGVQSVSESERLSRKGS